MKLRLAAPLVALLLLSAPAATRADLTPYSQDFETLVQADLSALASDGWVIWGNVFPPADTIPLYAYGIYLAPNTGGNAFCAIDAGQGGAAQGFQQLSVYADYENSDGGSNLIESNVYHEQSVGAADVNAVWTLEFDAKLGNLDPPSTAVAFIKTVDPSNGFWITNLVEVDMTAIPTTWGTYSISIPVDAGLDGQLMQFGFANRETGYIGSGVFYDNVSWSMTGVVGVGDARRPQGFELGAATPNPFVNSMSISYSLARRGRVDVSVYEVTGRRVATLWQGESEPGVHVATWDGRLGDGRLAPPGVYQCVLTTTTGRQARSLVLSR